MRGLPVKTVAILLAALSLTACATPKRPIGLYQWGGYDQMLYQGYQDPSHMETMRAELEAHIRSLEANQGRVAPGLYAELGTLYLQSGNTGRAIALYKSERDAWPESKGLMDAMIQNLERRQVSAGKAAP